MSREKPALAAISPRFASASAQSATSSSVSPERAERINRWAQMATERIGRNYEETRSLWIDQKYGELLAREGKRLSLQPGWAADDRKAHLMKAAAYLVQRNFEEKLATIERTAEALLSGKTPEQLKEQKVR